MYKKIVVLTAVALYGLLAFLSVVVTDFYDRNFSQELGVKSQVGIDFTGSTLTGDAALQKLQKLNQDYRLGLYRELPDLDDTGAQVFVDLNAENINESVAWFGTYKSAKILGIERLENSPVGGTYLVTESALLDNALKELTDLGVTAVRTDASPMESIINFAQNSGFAAPVIAGCALIAAITVFWLTLRAQSRALRVLAGGVPLRIQLQDLGGLALILAVSALGVATVGSLLVGLTRGWVYVPLFATVVIVLESVTLVVSLAVALIVSIVSWPNTELFAKRLPAVQSLRWTAKIVQLLTFVILIAYTGPSWTATQNAQQNATQLQAWHELSDQVRVAFGMDEEYLDVIAPQFEQVVEVAEANNEVALSYTFTEELWEDDFEGYSAITLVNSGWIELMEKSVGVDALTEVTESSVSTMLGRVLGESLELWSGRTNNAAQALADIAIYEPSAGVRYPVANGGSLGQLSFLDDVLVLEVSSIGAVFDDRNIVSLASTGNIIFTGAEQTRERLDVAGLDQAGLDKLNVVGTLRTVFVAEQGILEAQFATYLAQILIVSMIALALALLVAAAVNAVIAGLLNAHRDFPIRLTGAAWEQVIRPRALREVTLGAMVGIVIIVFQPVSTMGVTSLVVIAGVAALYFSHLIAASIIFDRVTRRKL